MDKHTTRRDFLKASLAGAAGFTGNLNIEREAGSQRVADIRAARECLEKLAPQAVSSPVPAPPSRRPTQAVTPSSL
jgi:hypothetical protein